MSIVWNIARRKSNKINILICLIILNLLILNWSKFNLGTTVEINSSPFLLEYNHEAKEAEVKIIIWFDNQDSIEGFREILPLEEWHWEESVRDTPEGQKAISLVGQTKIDRLAEIQLKKWYFDWVGKINTAGGQVYLDERILETIDIVAFLSQSGAEPKQWMLAGTTLSVAALKPGLGRGVHAGKDQINMQLLTRSSGGHQQSVLALPTLIVEF